jgi:hypothetical protein
VRLASAWAWIVAIAALTMTFAAYAQIIDTVEVRQQGDDAVIRVNFAVLIQYLRHVPAEHGTAVRIFFQITGGDTSALGLITEERRPQPTNLLPKFRVIYPAQAPGPQRFIDVVFDSAVDFRVSPQGNSTLLVYVRLSPEKLEELRGARTPAAAAPGEPSLSAPLPGESKAPAGVSAPATTVIPGAPPPMPTPGSPAATPPERTEVKPPTAALPSPPTPPQEGKASAAVPPGEAQELAPRIAGSPPPLTLPPPTVLSGPVTDIDRKAALDVADARGALLSGSNDKAIVALNRALELPPNAYSPEAQELMGIARERNLDVGMARAEYRTYLERYPDGPGAVRVRDRLNALPAKAGEAAARRPTTSRPLALPPPTVVSGAPSDIDKQAAADVADARSSLMGGDYEKAVVSLNRALNLPPNAYSQEAQELIGIARERNGEFAKALAEYELYLKLYPEGPGAARVREDLNALAVPPQPMGGAIPSEAGSAAPVLTAWGSLAQYYYGGQSQINNTRTITTPATGATTLETAQISGTDQSQLVNNVDLTARYRDGNWDSRFVWRDQYVLNFLRNGHNQTYLNALYGETRYLPGQLMARVGRQSSTTGGILGLFDGVVGSWGFLPNYRVNAVVGQPVPATFNTNSTFYGASVEADKLGDRFGGDAFAIWQVASGQTDRLGLGGELRYFDPDRNLYSMVDYDPVFHAVNIGMLQGTWQLPSLTSINFLVDYRRTPTLQLTNALVAYPGVSLSTLIQQQGVDAVRGQAKALTPLTKQALIGVTQQVSSQWQLGFDARWSSLTGTPPFQDLPATPGSGSVWTYTLQAIGSGLTKLQDILVLNGGWLTSAKLKAENASVDYRFVPIGNLTLEPLFGWYHQTDDQGSRATRYSPGLRLSYRLLNRFTIEGQFNLERTTTQTDQTNDTVRRIFWYLGWRWDF